MLLLPRIGYKTDSDQCHASRLARNNHSLTTERAKCSLPMYRCNYCNLTSIIVITTQKIQMSSLEHCRLLKLDLKREPPYDAASFFGALAQLGERNTGSVEVSGSIPLGSTNLKG